MREVDFGSMTHLLIVKVGDMPKTILVQDPDVLIRLDLAQTVMDVWPTANVILCCAAREVISLLSGGQKADVVILRQSLRSLRKTGLAGAIGRPDIRVLLTGADDDEAPMIAAAGWRTLDMPFTAPQVRAALREACTDQGLRAESHCNAIGLG
ncbi:hypothetical protein [Pseudotabrizicola algicola]|uniref:Response regulatory domain-containing protein n=1 Tax=Pseudotabrizicola algicola TaxID=2709381 RepID=A0A6B3RL92_9RHOB|nr:hypothetical protein [Pseudotabrizicola algicola]NEX45648.1 hypothetical protein [Pseudotabrizicola algicola]